MAAQSVWLTWLAIGLIAAIVGIGLALAGRRTRISNARGNVIVGDVRGTTTQTYTEAPAPAAPGSGIGAKEIIGWVIAVPAALLALGNFWKLLAGP